MLKKIDQLNNIIIRETSTVQDAIKNLTIEVEGKQIDMNKQKDKVWIVNKFREFKKCDFRRHLKNEKHFFRHFRIDLRNSG